MLFFNKSHVLVICNTKYRYVYMVTVIFREFYQQSFNVSFSLRERIVYEDNDNKN